MSPTWEMRSTSNDTACPPTEQFETSATARPVVLNPSMADWELAWQVKSMWVQHLIQKLQHLPLAAIKCCLNYKPRHKLYDQGFSKGSVAAVPDFGVRAQLHHVITAELVLSALLPVVGADGLAIQEGAVQAAGVSDLPTALGGVPSYHHMVSRHLCVGDWQGVVIQATHCDLKL